VTGELESRLPTAALPFGLSPWTYDSASPALVGEGGILRLMPAAVGRGFYAPGDELSLRPKCNLSGKNDAFKLSEEFASYDRWSKRKEGALLRWKAHKLLK
jgi:hypothetical protein